MLKACPAVMPLCHEQPHFFAFGLNPTTNSTGQLPAVQRSGGNLSYSFNEPVGMSGITYGAYWGDNLVDWNPVTDTGTAPKHTFSVPTSGETKLFQHLRSHQRAMDPIFVDWRPR